MTPEAFNRVKDSVLKQADLSRKGGIDEDVRELVCRINEKPDLLTLSSCSGRIIVFREASTAEGKIKKKGCEWLYTDHSSVLDVGNVWSKVLSSSADVDNKDSNEGCVVLKFEPFILHVQCRTLEVAKKMHTIGYVRHIFSHLKL